MSRSNGSDPDLPPPLEGPAVDAVGRPELPAFIRCTLGGMAGDAKALEVAEVVRAALAQGRDVVGLCRYLDLTLGLAGDAERIAGNDSIPQLLALPASDAIRAGAGPCHHSTSRTIIPRGRQG